MATRVTNAEIASNVVTFTVASVSGLDVGYPIIAYFPDAPTEATFGGAFTITAVDATACTIAAAHPGGDEASTAVLGQIEIVVTWITDADVAAYLGFEPSTQEDIDYLASCTASAQVWCFRRRAAAGYLDLPQTIPSADVAIGTVWKAAQTYRQRGGFGTAYAELPDLAASGVQLGDDYAILKQLGLNRPVAV